MSKLMSFPLLGTAVVGLLAAAVPAMAYTGQGLARHAKISMDEARAIALKTIHPGVITDEKLEYKKGGGGLRYTFVVRQHSHEDGTVFDEIGVDARSGKVLEDKIESPHSS